ncbi:NAT9 family protein [Megaselia abdita]
MRLNENTKILGKKVILVPYEEKHVEKYHEWMKSPKLQELTASEPLTLEEEYEMQRSWRNDDDKCTFLILSKEVFEETGNEIESLIGDTNIFLSEDEELTGEAEIMIAEKGFQGKGLGWEAMVLMLKYGAEFLKIQKFCVKIGELNEKSLKMFSKLGFEETSRSTVFKEVTLDKSVDNSWIEFLDNNGGNWDVKSYR